MKRFIMLLLLLSTLMTPYWEKTIASPEGTYLRDTAFFHSLQLNSSRPIGEMVILPSGEYSIREAASMISNLDHVPSSLLEKAADIGIKVILFNGELTSQPALAHLKGKVPRGYINKETTWDDVPGAGGTKNVYAKIGHSDKGQGHGSINLELHELAHSLDRYVYTDPYQNLAFTAIWKEEANKLFPGQPYFLDYQEEYFAETFAMMYLNENTRSILRQRAPKTYKYFASLN
ncbi:MAG TPA: hypothetical protein VEY51_02600 [Chondromyces sp.]|nr:hypothetical protein [Chondromyces sp.]